MSPLEVIQLIGYGLAAALHLWMGALLVKRSPNLGRLERVLRSLALAVGTWHACNLVLALHSMLGFDVLRWKTFLRVTNSVAVVAITLSYSLLLHVHLYLWANHRRRPLNTVERVRVYLSYLPAVFLTIAVWKLWREPYGPMYEKLDFLLLPFALWAVYCLLLVAATDFLIARSNESPSESRLLKTLAASFVGIAALIFAVYVFRVGRGETFLYLQTVANMGSLVPTALLAYQIYRYRYLELIIKESLVVATFAAVILVVYLYGIRTVGEWLTVRYGLRAGLIESILILTLALVAAPLRSWLDRRFHRLFEHEVALYRDVVTSIGANAGRDQQLPELLRFVEERIGAGLGLRRVRIITDGRERPASDNEGGLIGDAGQASEAHSGVRVKAYGIGKGESSAPVKGELSASGEDGPGESESWAEDLRASLSEQFRLMGFEPLEGVRQLREQGFELAYALRREDRDVGVMLVDAPPDALTRDVRAVLEILAGQVAIAVEDCRLVAENVQLERRLAHRERLAALGQMAATVAHEIRNPLSAIKSIVQVMREDERLQKDYSRDLDLIVGETDRLSRSVTQMLSFARNAPHADTPRRLSEIVGAVIYLHQSEANARGARIHDDSAAVEAELDGATAGVVRDAVSNLLLNALQATPRGGVVRIEASREDDARVRLSITDEGPGVPDELRERIWEPFFTTRQRGTGLGLSIVRKRIEEIGGSASLAAKRNGEGASFELDIPLRRI